MVKGDADATVGPYRWLACVGVGFCSAPRKIQLFDPVNKILQSLARKLLRSKEDPLQATSYVRKIVTSVSAKSANPTK